MSATFRDVNIPPEEAVIVLMHLEIMRKDTAVGFFPFTIPEGEHTTGLTDCYIDLIRNSAYPAGRTA
jgi:hypothetical protein